MTNKTYAAVLTELRYLRDCIEHGIDPAMGRVNDTIRQAETAQAQAQPVMQQPVAIVAVSPNCGATVGWMPGYIAKHNDKLYSAPQPEPTAPAEMPEFARYEVRQGVLIQGDAGRFCLFKDVQAEWRNRS